MYGNMFIRMCLSILFMEAVNGLGLKRRLELMNMGYQICGDQHEPPAFSKRCCYKKDQSKFFYEDKSICCDGEVYDKFDKFNNTRRICCNNKVINADQFICCQNRKHLIPIGNTRHEIGCCGNMIKTKYEMCCLGSSKNTKQNYSDGTGCCNGELFNKQVFWCQGTELRNRYEERCGNRIIPLQKHSCCNDVVNDYPVYKRNNIEEKDENRECCGESPYDSSTHTCCPDYKSIIPKDPVFACCGTGYFNTTAGICCDKEVYTREYGKDSVCCGHEQINIAEKDCCDGKSYDKRTSKCCLGYSAGKVMSLNDLCCDGQDVTEDSLCCNSIKLIKKSDPSHDSCCLGNSLFGAMSYNSIEKVCENGVLMTKRPDGKEFCGENAYDPKHFICCNNQLTQIIDGTRPACCGFTTIDENIQKCCKEYAIDYPTDEGICCFNEDSDGCHYNDESCSCTMKCNDTLYNPNSEICCGEKLYKKNDVTECCGKLPLYNKGNHTCCNGVRYNGSRECCGQRVLKDNENCCGDFVVQKRSRKSQKCCSYVSYGRGLSLPYDPLFSDCNEKTGTVVSRPSKIYSPACRLSKAYKRNDIYGWIPAACTSKYGFLGTITNIDSKWDKRTKRGYQTVTLTDVRKLKGRKFGGKTLKFRIEYTKSKPCFSRIKRLKNLKVALFTSATFEGGYFDFVDHGLSRNDIQYSNNEFYVVKVTRHVRHSFQNLRRSRFCDFRYQYRYTSLIR